jgi:hypothetical protein
MKINTKTTPPVKGSPHSFQNDNRFIPATAFEEGNSKGEGRAIFYESVVVSTPVLASARLHSPESCKNKSVLTKIDVDELNSKLNSLYIGSPTSTTKETTTEISKKEAPSAKCTPIQKKEEVQKDQKVQKFREEEEPVVIVKEVQTCLFSLGRISLTVYDCKTNGFIEVLRSARLALKLKY